MGTSRRRTPLDPCLLGAFAFRARWSPGGTVKVHRTAGALGRLTGWGLRDAPEAWWEIVRAEVERACWQPGRVITAVHQVLAADGEQRWLRLDLRARVRLDGRGRVDCVTRDVTELWRVREERDRLRRALDLVSRQVGEQEVHRAESLNVLAGGLAHDFNNLLVSIVGSAELALQVVESRCPARPALERIRGSGWRAAEISRQVLEFAGAVADARATLDLGALVEESVAGLPARPPGAELVLRRAPDPLPVEVDAPRVRQVIVNLVTNALEALEGRPGRVEVATRRTSRLPPGRRWLPEPAPEGPWACVEVTDTGGGIPREHLEHIFDPFWTTRPAGRGLGLAVVHGVTRVHGGALRVRSSPVGGSRFQVFIPLREIPAGGEGGRSPPAP